MDPPAVTGSGFGERYTMVAYNNNFSDPSRFLFNRSAEQNAVSKKTSLIIAILHHSHLLRHLRAGAAGKPAGYVRGWSGTVQVLPTNNSDK
ncbi:hypothetical protein Baya_11295 [Bagarius yarrelli]|uniref:Uncharacterized protein n=1 Tax=Bagarius yarrelli TaxID=175774 RepID=A0A556V0B9_BAGYA|nr:hypothetical protein Baya_11295 [Bagarius yarrelli]